jgi:Protein of unknown function (DUF3168)
MTPVENDLRAALIAWLQADPALAAINAIEEESPLSASPPWLGIAASASIDWGTKDRAGRETRIALELETRTDVTAADAPLLAAIERRVLDLPPFHPGFELASIRFLRSRSDARADNRRAALLEYRFRVLAPITE